MARMKKQNGKYKKINKLAKLKTRKGGLGKNEHPDGLTTFKGNSSKKQGHLKIYSPVDWKPERAIQAKIGWYKKKKTNKSKHAKKKSIDHGCIIQSALDSRASSNSSTIKRSHSLQVYERDTIPSLQQWPWCVFKRRHPQKRNSCKYMSEREPLRTQYSNV